MAEPSMKFEVFNEKGVGVMETAYPTCVPCDRHLDSMVKAGYKFKIDGKIVNKKKVKEIREGDGI